MRQNIHQEIFNLKQEILKIEEKCELKKYKIYAKIKAVRKKCKHKHLTFCDDPSGGNDSYNECADCGERFY
jgi:hypothetical protein